MGFLNDVAEDVAHLTTMVAAPKPTSAPVLQPSNITSPLNHTLACNGTQHVNSTSRLNGTSLLNNTCSNFTTKEPSPARLRLEKIGKDATNDLKRVIIIFFAVSGLVIILGIALIVWNRFYKKKHGGGKNSELDSMNGRLEMAPDREDRLGDMLEKGVDIAKKGWGKVGDMMRR